MYISRKNKQVRRLAKAVKLAERELSNLAVAGTYREGLFQGSVSGLNTAYRVATEELNKLSADVGVLDHSIFQDSNKVIDSFANRFYNAQRQDSQLRSVGTSEESYLTMATCSDPIPRMEFIVKLAESMVDEVSRGRFSSFRATHPDPIHASRHGDRTVKIMTEVNRLLDCFVDELIPTLADQFTGDETEDRQKYCLHVNNNDQTFVLDSLSEDHGTPRSVNEWLNYWESSNDGRYMVSMSDIYAAAKTIKNLREHNEIDTDMHELLLDSFRYDTLLYGKSARGLVTSTFFVGTSLDAEIIHNYETDRETRIPVTIPTYPRTIKIYAGPYRPHYEDVIEQCTEFFPSNDHPECQQYAQALFNTEDDLDTIREVINKLLEPKELSLNSIPIPIAEKEGEPSAYGLFFSVCDAVVDFKQFEPCTHSLNGSAACTFGVKYLQ